MERQKDSSLGYWLDRRKKMEDQMNRKVIVYVSVSGEAPGGDACMEPIPGSRSSVPIHIDGQDFVSR